MPYFLYFHYYGQIFYKARFIIFKKLRVKHMSKKIITINPELLKTKTKKISPKLINKTLINRIKEKKKEKKVQPYVKQTTDKFDESNHFLSSILQNHPKKTIKVHKPLNNYSQPPITKSVENLLFKPDNSEVVNINYKIDTEKPYGNMVGGLKPTLKKWKTGKKPMFPTHVKNVIYSEEEEEKRLLESEINKKINGKTEFSTDLLAKFQNDDDRIVISDEDAQIEPEIFDGHVSEKPLDFQPVLQPIDLKPLDLQPLNLQPLDLQPIDIQPVIPVIQPVLQPIDLKPLDLQPLVQPNTHFEPKIIIKPNLKPEEEKLQENTEEELVHVNQTIKRKYLIGKKGNKVGMIVSNKKTRKNISECIKEFKNTPIEKMKEELKKVGLIQVGSSAPNEVVRKIYEYSRLAGDVQNDNKEILMNNLLNDN